MNSQFKKGVLELCTLSLISKKDCYGYELVTQISEFIDITEGTIYPILRRLTKEKYCSTYLKESAGGPPRKYYKITKAGKDSLKAQSSEWEQFTEQINNLLNAGDENE